MAIRIHFDHPGYSHNDRGDDDACDHRDHDDGCNRDRGVDDNRNRDYGVDGNCNRGRGADDNRDRGDVGGNRNRGDVDGNHDHGDDANDHRVRNRDLYDVRGIYARSAPCSQSTHGCMGSYELHENRRAAPLNGLYSYRLASNV